MNTIDKIRTDKSSDIYDNPNEVEIHGRVRWAWNGKKL